MWKKFHIYIWKMNEGVRHLQPRYDLRIPKIELKMGKLASGAMFKALKFFSIRISFQEA